MECSAVHPNHLSSHDLGAVTSDYEALSSDPNQPLLNRAEFQSYDIGSLFTIVTAAATAIEEGLHDFAVPPVRSVARAKVHKRSCTMPAHAAEICGHCCSPIALRAGQRSEPQLVDKTSSDISQRLGITAKSPIRLDGSPKGALEAGSLNSSASYAAAGEGLKVTPCRLRTYLPRLPTGAPECSLMQ